MDGAEGRGFARAFARRILGSWGKAVPESFHIHQQETAGVRIFRLEGFLDAHTAPQFEEALQARVAEGERRIVVDCSALTYISSAGLGVFMSFIEEVRDGGGDIRIAGLIPKVRQVFDILGFSEIFQIFESTSEAIASFAASADETEGVREG